MKNLFYYATVLAIFSLIAFPVLAQKRTRSMEKRNAVEAPVKVRFIEGIEINRAIQPHSEVANQENIVNVPASNSTASSIEQSLPVQFKFAQVLNRNVEAIVNITLFNFIDEWWETRYRYGGTTKAGIDCSAFAGLLLSKVFGTQIPRTAKDQFIAAEKLQRENLAEGDLVFFNTRGGISHVGVYLGGGYFVHASTVNGVTISHLDDDYYSARFLGGGRIVRPTTVDAVVKTVL